MQLIASTLVSPALAGPTASTAATRASRADDGRVMRRSDSSIRGLCLSIEPPIGAPAEGTLRARTQPIPHRRE